MVIEINTIVSVGQAQGGRHAIPNITLQNCKFFGRPNFAGEINRFKETKRQFTVLIPNDVADQLREIGYNVKTKIPTPEDLRENPELGEISFLKVAVDEDKANVFIKMGDAEPTKLSPDTLGVIDNSRLEDLDMELRGWMYNKDEVEQGVEAPAYSARVVTLIATLRPNLLQEKYGNLV